MTKIKKSANDAALTYLSYKDRTAAEVERSLAQKGYTPAEIEKTMAFLLDYNLIDDARYCEKFVRDALQRRQAAGKITAALLDKGVSRTLISQSLAANMTEETAMQNALAEADAYIEKKGLTTQAKDVEKVLRRLFYLGYEPDIVYKVAKLLRIR